MGNPTAEQTVAIIDSVARAIEPHTPPPDPEPWWQIFAIIGGTIAALLTAWAAWKQVKK